MALRDVQEILEMFGAGTVLCVGASDPALAAGLRRHGALVECADVLDELLPWREDAPSPHDCLIIEAGAMLDSGTLDARFAQLYPMARRWVVIRFAEHRDLLRTSQEAGRSSEWENAAVRAGFRRAPQAVSCERYVTECNDPLVPPMLAFERIAPAALAAFPFEQLLANRNLHMDMSREAGARADAHMVRYALAATLVRPGDTVLDCACGLGYGSAILAAQSAGARYIGVDIDPGSTAYASANFGNQYGIDYVSASATDLAFLEDDSIDLVVTFETIEHVDDYQAFINEALRVLRPDGRIIASVPNLWVDETGRDPNPYHFHAFDYAKFRATMSACFLLEERYAQSAPGGFKLRDWPRMLDKLALDGPADETEWLMLVGSVDPLAKAAHRRASGLQGTGAAPAPESGWQVADAAGHDQNGWLQRSVIDPRTRLRDPDALADLAGRALGVLAMDSADFGAVLTVLGSSVLEQSQLQHVDDLLPLIDAYLGRELADPHAKRWQMAAAGVAARLLMARGERELAKGYLSAIVDADFMEFGPALAAESISAAFDLGAIALADAEPLAAAAHFSAGVQASRRALAADGMNAMGEPGAPWGFELSALAQVAELGARCARALKLLPLAQRSPGQFWIEVGGREASRKASPQ